MSHRIIFHALAEKDLADLYDYIADQTSAERAWSYIQSIKHYCEQLTTFPERGLHRRDIREGLRVVGYRRSASIAFCIRDGNVIILGIFYRGRQISLEVLADRSAD